MSSTRRSEHLDSVLTGLAMFQAYLERDEDTLAHLTEAVPCAEAVKALLASMELISGIFATQMGADVTYVTSSVRRRIVRELVSENERDLSG